FELFSDRLSLEGCDTMLSPSAAQNFALILHELATNATKHGALSVPGGRVEVMGATIRSDSEDALYFQWRELGGPPATGPTRKGFGSKILFDMAQEFADIKS